MNTLDSLLENVSELPSLPAVAMRIIQEVKKENFAVNDLASIISYDPALSAKILKVANSPYYALPFKVDSVDKAVNILGIKALKNIALSFVIVKGLKRNSLDGFDHNLFWKRSITTAVSAEMIAEKLNVKLEDTFVTSLLMDIGIIVMYISRRDEYLKVLDEKRILNLSTVEAEKNFLGCDHQEVGSEILRRWGLPENICQPVAYHHRINEAPPSLRDTLHVLMLSNMASSIYHGKKSVEKFQELNELLQDRLSLTATEVGEFIDSIADKTVGILSNFEIDAGNLKPYSQILEDAVAELGKLNLSYEQLVMELKQEKMKVEDLAKELKNANEKLRELAVKDGLTNLYNRRFFQNLMEKELESAGRYSHNLSLIMIDIDHFKKINDTFGHPAGDDVLRSVTGLLTEALRKSDTAARYGGEEFVVVLPETDIKGAVTLAERIRKLVEKAEIMIDAKAIRITVSLGVTTYTPGKGTKNVAELIKSADTALYNSKQTGRNKISISQ
ncbi:MAG: diguanylate cyclase [Nitrospiraceae bacterium]|nr:MAG: diguanylate cyclase [Nitrospiraceae bacterium]